jgi:hypothetical protein
MRRACGKAVDEGDIRKHEHAGRTARSPPCVPALTAEFTAASPTASTVRATPISTSGDAMRAFTALPAARCAGEFEAAVAAAAEAASRWRMVAEGGRGQAYQDKRTRGQREEECNPRVPKPSADSILS